MVTTTPTRKRASDAQLHAWVLAYQEDLAAAGGDTAAQPPGRHGGALALLLEAMEPLLWDAARKAAVRRLGCVPPDLLDDLLNEGRLRMIQAARTWSPTGGASFRSYSTGRAGVQAAMLQFLDDTSYRQSLTRSQGYVAAYARGVLADAVDELDGDDLSDLVWSRAMDWSRSKVLEAQPDLGGEELEDAAVDKLRKSGFKGSLLDLGELLPLSETQMQLDALDFEPATTSPTDDEPDVLLRVASIGLDEHQRDDVLLALTCGEPDLLRPLLGAVRARLGAPHAQFAATSPLLMLQFDEPATRPGVRETMLALD